MGDTVSPRRHEYASLVMSVPDKYAFKATDKQTNEKRTSLSRKTTLFCSGGLIKIVLIVPSTTLRLKISVHGGVSLNL